MLHLYAVEKILSGLEPPIKPKRVSPYSDDQSLRVWLNTLRELSNAIESTLSLSSQHPIAHKARCDSLTPVVLPSQAYYIFQTPVAENKSYSNVHRTCSFEPFKYGSLCQTTGFGKKLNQYCVVNAPHYTFHTTSH